MKLSGICLPSRKDSLYTMMEKGRFDFTLSGLSNEPDMRITVGKRILLPIKGYKVVFDNTFHYFVSRKTKNADQIIAAINKGLSILHNEGYIRKIFTKNGVIHKDAVDWINLAEP